MLLPINPPKNITVKAEVPAEVINNVDEIDIITISDNTVDEVKAVIIVKDFPLTLVLWEGQAYIDIGDWKQVDANNRILELLN